MVSCMPHGLPGRRLKLEGNVAHLQEMRLVRVPGLAARPVVLLDSCRLSAGSLNECSF